MSVVSDRHRRLAYVDESSFFSEHPKDFLKTSIYRERIAEARRIILRTVLRLGPPSRPNDSLFLESSLSEDLASFVDGLDRARSLRVREQALLGAMKFGGEWRVRSPQQMLHRRRTLFSLDDIPGSWLFFDPASRQRRDYEPFIDLMRWHLIHDAVKEMLNEQEIWHMNGIWQIAPSVMDAHRLRSSRGKKSVKTDDRSFHGRPNRDRKRTAA